MIYNSKQISKALRSINPEFSFVIENSKIVTWYSNDPQPTEEEIVQKIAELEYQEEVNEYQRQRAAEYPSYADQFDQIYHEGVDAWKASIKEVKDKYPKVIMDPDELQARQDQAIFELQTERYLKATERLAQYILLEGRPEITEEIVIRQEPVLDDEDMPTFDEDGNMIMVDITETSLVQSAVEPLEEFLEVTEFDEETKESVIVTIRNPEVVKDEEEREEAQAVIDAVNAEEQ
jgi:hypothetical protein